MEAAFRTELDLRLAGDQTSAVQATPARCPLRPEAVSKRRNSCAGQLYFPLLAMHMTSGDNRNPPKEMEDGSPEPNFPPLPVDASFSHSLAD